MSYFYTMLSLIIFSTSVFAMDRIDRKGAIDRMNKDYSSYNPKDEIYEQRTPPNKSVADISADSNQKK